MSGYAEAWQRMYLARHPGLLTSGALGVKDAAISSDVKAERGVSQPQGPGLAHFYLLQALFGQAKQMNFRAGGF